MSSVIEIVTAPLKFAGKLLGRVFVSILRRGNFFVRQKKASYLLFVSC